MLPWRGVPPFGELQHLHILGRPQGQQVLTSSHSQIIIFTYYCISIEVSAGCEFLQRTTWKADLDSTGKTKGSFGGKGWRRQT